MGELQLSEQDVDLLVTALELLLQRTRGIEDCAALQFSIQSMTERLNELHGEERAQAIAVIQKALSEIASGLESNSFDTGKPSQD